MYGFISLGKSMWICFLAYKVIALEGGECITIVLVDGYGAKSLIVFLFKLFH